MVVTCDKRNRYSKCDKCKCRLKTGYINSSGVNIFYRLRGNPQKRPTIVFLHGFPYSGAVWECQQRFFCCKGFATLAIDTRGFGKSDKPLDMTNASIVNDFHTVIQKLGIVRPIVVGSSIGGFYAMLWAITFPGDISRLITVGSFTSIEKFASPQALQIVGLWLTGQISYASFVEQFTNLSISETCNDPCITNLKIFLNKLGLQASEVSARNSIIQNGGADISGQINQIRIPSLITFGNIDQVVQPAASIFIYNNIPSAQLVGFANAGHFPFATHVDLFNKTLYEYLVNDCDICENICPPCNN